MGRRAEIDAGSATVSNEGDSEEDARLKAKWLLFGAIISAAAQSLGEHDHLDTLGTLGGFNYRLKQNREAKKRIDMHHNEVVAHFRLRRLSTEGAPHTQQSGPLSPTTKANQEQQLNHLQQQHRSTEAAKLASWTEPWNPDATWRKFWNLTIMVIVCAQGVYVPFIVAFRPEAGLAWRAFEYVVDSIFIADIALTFNTKIKLGGDVESSQDAASSAEELVKDRRKIAAAYVRGFFFVDLIASIPMELIGLAIGQEEGTNTNGAQAATLAKALRIPRLFRLLRMMRLFRLLQGPLKARLTYFFYYSSHANALKLLRLLCAIMLICHYAACIFYGGAAPQVWYRMEDCDGTSCYHASTPMKYVTSFYTIFLLMNGEETGPKTDNERLFAIAAILTGSVMVATIFGNVSIIIMNFSADQSAYRKKMESLYENMNHLQLPQGLKARIVDYYDHMWRNYRSLDGKVTLFIPELNHSLASEILLCMRTSIITNVPFFVQCSPDVIKEFVVRLETEIYLKGDYIIHKGVPGNEMYLISRGKCEVTNHFIRRETFEAKEDKEDKANEGRDGGIEGGEDAGIETLEGLPKRTAGGSQNPKAPMFRMPVIGPGRGSWVVAPQNQGRLSALRADFIRLRATIVQAKRTAPASDHQGQAVSSNRGPRSGATEKPNGEVGYDQDRKHSGSKRPGLVAVEKVLRVLPRGSYFGEVALITNARRGCNVRARAFCEIQILKRSVFEAIMEDHPDEKRVIKALLLQKCSKDELEINADIRVAGARSFERPKRSTAEEDLQELSLRLCAIERGLTSHLQAQNQKQVPKGGGGGGGDGASKL